MAESVPMSTVNAAATAAPLVEVIGTEKTVAPCRFGARSSTGSMVKLQVPSVVDVRVLPPMVVP